MSVRPPVCFRMHSVNFIPIGLGKVPKDAKFSEVVHITFRYRNFLLIFRKSAENRFPWKFRKFKFFHIYPFYDCSRGKKGPWFRIISFPDIRNYRTAGIHRIFTRKFWDKLFLLLSDIFGDSEFWLWFFRITAKIPNVTVNAGRNYFFSFWLINS